jgi:CRISPR/Cas system-associated protein Cas5 (RAMP superfamily)
MKTLDKQNIWIIANWEKLIRLEDAIGRTRENYVKVFGEIHKVVKQRHPALNRMTSHFSPKEIRDYETGQAAFSSTNWPYKYESWRTGIYISGISLDELSGEKQTEQPAITIWVGTDDKIRDKKVEILRRRLSERSKKVFAGKNLQLKSVDGEDYRTCLMYPLPEDRSKLLDLLVKRDSKGFIDCMVNHVNLMASFIPIIDEVLAK